MGSGVAEGLAIADKADIASIVLAHVAKGERDPVVLKAAALTAITECTRYSHDISLERRAA